MQEYRCKLIYQRANEFPLKRYFILYLVIAIMLTVGPFIAPATSVAPGWHTVILPPYFILSISILIWFYALAAIYYYLESKKYYLPRQLMLIHLFLSLCYFPYALNTVPFDLQNIWGYVGVISLILFVFGQFLFVLYVLMKGLSS